MTTVPANDRIKQRTLTAAPVVRDERRLVFYAAVFNAQVNVTEFGESFTETIRPGAFRRSLSDGRVIPVNLEHDPSTVFASTQTGLILQEDGRGLFASVYLPPSPVNDTILHRVRTGIITGASFQSLDAPGGRLRTFGAGMGGLPLDEVLDMVLIDVCLSAGRQVYRETAVSLRTQAVADAMMEAQRLRMLKLKSRTT